MQHPNHEQLRELQKTVSVNIEIMRLAKTMNDPDEFETAYEEASSNVLSLGTLLNETFDEIPQFAGSGDDMGLSS